MYKFKTPTRKSVSDLHIILESSTNYLSFSTVYTYILIYYLLYYIILYTYIYYIILYNIIYLYILYILYTYILPVNLNGVVSVSCDDIGLWIRYELKPTGVDGIASLLMPCMSPSKWPIFFNNTKLMPYLTIRKLIAYQAGQPSIE